MFCYSSLGEWTGYTRLPPVFEIYFDFLDSLTLLRVDLLRVVLLAVFFLLTVMDFLRVILFFASDLLFCVVLFANVFRDDALAIFFVIR